ncbi:MAG: BspA family leucine-rich repeat surface protein [Candidatus Heimdallarchaeota archaeon]|nr:BspA family leucine-rich repeat surface protein [Candidatus Heimdallarchaeota archaeon]
MKLKAIVAAIIMIAGLTPSASYHIEDEYTNTQASEMNQNQYETFLNYLGLERHHEVSTRQSGVMKYEETTVQEPIIDTEDSEINQYSRKLHNDIAERYSDSTSKSAFGSNIQDYSELGIPNDGPVMKVDAINLDDYSESDWFITEWNTSLGDGDNSITLSIVNTGTYDFVVLWGDGTNSTVTGYNTTAATHIFDSSGVYNVTVIGIFEGWSYLLGASPDRNKLIAVHQWGSMAFGPTRGHFYGAQNLQIKAIDAPDLSKTTDMSLSFQGALKLNSSLSHWNTSTITDMNSMFNGAKAFNGDLSGWNTSQVTNMPYMFQDADAFNQSLNSWDVSKVTNMYKMFFAANSFSQDLDQWDVSSVTDMGYMFSNNPFNGNISTWQITSLKIMDSLFGFKFNGDVSKWNTSTVTSMYSTFRSAAQFSGNISAWDTSLVTDMSLMFDGAYKFNSDISSWKTSNVLNMFGMFRDAYLFNQDITGWDVSKVTDMQSMFTNNPVFNQDISTWDVSSVTTMFRMFKNTTVFNQDLDSWDTSAVEGMSEMFMDTKAFNGNISGWDVSSVDDASWHWGFEQMFENAEAFNRDILGWDLNADVSYMFKNAKVFNGDISSWDMRGVTGVAYMFDGAITFNQDLPNWQFSTEQDLSYMFYNATAFNGDLTNWDVSRVDYMDYMFQYAYSFNGSLANWDTRDVDYMRGMFDQAHSFNGNLTAWDVSSVTYFDYMFRDAWAFNQDISNWNTATGQYYRNMFQNTYSFNQRSLNWPMAFADYLNSMFYNATYVPDISSWDISGVYQMNNMFDFSGLDMFTYDKVLLSWSKLSVKSYVTLGAVGVQYTQTTARVFLDVTKSWTIYDGGFNSSYFVSVWDTSLGTVDNTITLPLVASGSYDFTVYYGNATAFHVISYDSTNATASFPVTGTYIFYILGTIEGFSINYGADRLNIIDVSNWGPLVLGDTTNQFFGAQNMQITATDVPDLSQTTSLDYAFHSADSLGNADLSGWNTSTITSMRYTFADTNNFNGDISTWDVSHVTLINSMFSNAAAFDQSLNAWNVSSVQYMPRLFANAVSFQGDISSWDVSNVINMNEVFLNAELFNADISSWDVSNVQYFDGTFSETIVFNQNIGSWNVSSATTMRNMFYNSVAFNQSLNSWDVSSVTDMEHMFRNSNFNGAINIWDTSSVTSMMLMFDNNPVFNQPIGSWNVSQVTNMYAMFSYASAFNQSLSAWDTSKVTDMAQMFKYAIAFNQALNSWDTSSVKYMAEMFYYASVFNQDLDLWDVTGVSDFKWMFARTDAFNGNISTWDLSSATSLFEMFQSAEVFNGDISSWNVTGVTDFSGMFNSAYAFNIDISSWNLYSATNLYSMFNAASTFDQDLSSWNISGVTNMRYLFYLSGLSQQNYDKILLGWSTQTVYSDIILDVSASYTLVLVIINARQTLETAGWTINDGGFVADSIAPVVSSIANVTYLVGDTPGDVSWTLTEDYPGTYTIEENGIEITGTTNYIDGEIVGFTVSGYSPGHYNITIIVLDSVNNMSTQTFFILVTEENNPEIIVAPGDFDMELGSTGNTINWTVGDQYPGTYTVIYEGPSTDMLVASTSWSNGTLSIEIDTFDLGIWNFTIILTDTSGNTVNDTVQVTVKDTIIPYVDSPSDITYEQGNNGNSILWTWGDRDTANYTISINGISSLSGGLVFNTTIDLKLLDLSPGTYTYVLTIDDASGNRNSDTVVIIVTPSTLPDLYTLPDYSYENGTLGHVLTWTVGDQYPYNYTITKDGSPVDSGTWTNGTISIDIDWLLVGNYTFVLYLQDMSSNVVSDEVLVTVFPDDVLPDLNNPDNYTYELGSIGNTIVWTVGDRNPANYTVRYDGPGSSNVELVAVTSWENGSLIIDADGFDLGIWNFTIYVLDTFGNLGKDSILVTVEDTVAPELDSPADVTFEEGRDVANLIWTWGDSDQATYTITINGGPYLSGSLFFNGSIPAVIKSYPAGIHALIITITDTAGNSISDTVIVTVTPPNPPTVDSPDNLSVDENSTLTSNQIIWNVSDTNPNTYRIEQDGVEIASGTWSNGTITVEHGVINALVIGTYNFTIILSDDLGYQSSDTVMVTILDVYDPILNSPADFSYEQGSTGNSILWTIDDDSSWTFVVTVNGVELNTGGPTTATQITQQVNGFDVGENIVVISVTDKDGNSASDTVIVTVTPRQLPSADSPADLNVGENSTDVGNEIIWTVSDNDPDTYNIEQNGVVIDSGAWSNGTITVDNSIINNLAVGTYVYVITLYDDLGNEFSDEVTVTIIDETDPILNSPADITYEEGDTGYSILWSIDDVSYWTFTITVNGAEQYSGGPTTGTEYTLNVNGYGEGIYIFVMMVTDKDGNQATDTVILSVTPRQTPSADSPNDLSVGETSTSSSNKIIWTVSDNDPTTYVIEQDGVQIDSGSWSNGTITIDYTVINNLSVGTYIFILHLTDSLGNEYSDSVAVTIIDETNPVLNSPADFGYELGSSGNSILWTIDDDSSWTFVITVNGVELNTGGPTIASQITQQVNGFEIGINTVVLTVTDAQGNIASDTVIINVFDTQNPSIGSPADFSIVNGTLGNSIEWSPSDVSGSGTWEISVNSEVVTSGTWTEPDTISFNVDDLPIGINIVSVSVTDANGNSVIDQVEVTVLDQTSPSVSTPEDVSLLEGSTGNSIIWSVTDLSGSGTYTVTRDSIEVVSSTSWTSGDAISVSIDGLPLGIYNYVITIIDANGNTVTDVVKVSVADANNPTLSTPADLSYEEGETGNSISWIANDVNPDTYLIYRNSLEIKSGSWTSGNDITVNVDGLVFGVYNFTIVISDIGGNQVVDTVFVTVTDTVPPIVSSPADIEYELGSTLNTIIWTLNDAHPNTYSVSRDGTEIGSDTWNDGFELTLDIDGLTVGQYIYVLTVTDVSGNEITNSVVVTVVDTVAPSIDGPADVSVELGNSFSGITWTVTDLDPAGYEIYINGSSAKTGVWVSGVGISVSLDVSSLGNYNITLLVSDVSGNNVSDTVIITVDDTTDPKISSPDDVTITEGDNVDLIWTISDAGNGTYEIADGINVVSGTWIPGDEIYYDLSSLVPGIYNIVLTITDQSGNSASDSATVTVEAIETTTSTTSTSTSSNPQDTTTTEKPPESTSEVEDTPGFSLLLVFLVLLNLVTVSVLIKKQQY